jgi:hypothetical protein
LPVDVGERNRGEGKPKQSARDAGDAVEGLARRRVQYAEVAQRPEPILLALSCFA